MLVAARWLAHSSSCSPQTVSMSTEPHSSPPEARPPGSRRRSVVALLALLVLGLGLTLWLTRPGVAPIIPLDAALATPGANPQTSDLYAPPQLPATSGQPSTPLPTVAPLTQATASAAAASREQPTALPASPTSLPSGTPVADAFAQAVAGPATPDDRPAPVGRTAGMAAQVQPPSVPAASPRPGPAAPWSEEATVPSSA